MATVDYKIKEPNVLSFRSGDIIQVVKENKQDKPPATGNWLYGKIGSRFGWFPVEYVQPMTIESEVNFFYRLNVFLITIYLFLLQYGSEIYTPSIATNNNYALPPQFKTTGVLYGPPTRGSENVGLIFSKNCSRM